MEDCTLADDDAMAVAAVGGSDDIENGYTLFEKSNIFIVVSANIILMAYCCFFDDAVYTCVRFFRVHRISACSCHSHCYKTSLFLICY